jgi:undecaprenyl-diphosphatase
MTFLQSFLFAIVQGIAELFPVSSLGHAVILPHLIGMKFNIADPLFLPFLTMLHLGTAAALLVYFWKDWVALFKSWRTSKLLWLLVIGTVPTGIIGLILQKKIEPLYASYVVASVFLVVNGIMLLVGEWLSRRQRTRGSRGNLESLTTSQAFWIGTAQSLALIPGISRSGSSLVGGLLAGLSHEAAARFSFLLATPIILAAGLLEVPKLLHHSGNPSLGTSVFGGIVAGVVAYASVSFLVKYFKVNETNANALLPFGVYSIIIGLLSLIIK